MSLKKEFERITIKPKTFKDKVKHYFWLTLLYLCSILVFVIAAVAGGFAIHLLRN